MSGARIRNRRVARVGIVLMVLFALSSLGAAASFAAGPFTISIDQPIAVSGLQVTMSGVADSPSGSSHHIDIAWGDASTDTIPLAGSGPWTWGPISHTYAAEGSYAITATLIHANEQGQDQSSASDSSDVVLPGCGSDCPTDGNVDGTTDGTTDGSVDGTTDGTTDGSVDGTTDGSTDGSTGGTVVTPVTNKPEVKGRVIHRKPLAHTASETASLAWLGMIVLMIGATIRFCVATPTQPVVATDSSDEMVARSLDLVTRIVGSKRR